MRDEFAGARSAVKIRGIAGSLVASVGLPRIFFSLRHGRARGENSKNLE